MAFQSILFRRTEDAARKELPELEVPDFFIDLNLNQIINTITTGKEEYNLKPFFYAPLNNIDAVLYRQEVMQDMEGAVLTGHVASFAQNMRAMRKQLPKTDKSYYNHQKERLFLEAVEIYCNTINSLSNSLSLVDLKSQGFITFREYLAGYIQSARFASLLIETKELIAALSSIKYNILISGLQVQVLKCKSEADYSAEMKQTFEKFKQEEVKDKQFEIFTSPDMNHVEAQILDGVASLYPDIFKSLDYYYTKNTGYIDETIAVFDREIQFYVAYTEHISKFRNTGLKFCYPKITESSKEVFNYEGFDLALAYNLVAQSLVVVCNDFYLKDKDRIIVVTGPNQGGKTTFARTFGQLHYLANIGCNVPGREAKLFLFDKVFTHFEKEENIKNMRSKLEDDLVRMHAILNQATSNSIIIMNEILSSTTLQDAIFLSKKVMEKITKLDALCIWVTFIDELTSLNEKTVSMVSTVNPDNPALRTFKIVRKPAEGLAYAISIAERYHLTYNFLKERIKS